MSKGYNFLGDKIKKLRNIRGFTQKELGDAIGLPKQSISMIEKGRRRISEEELKEACYFMSFPVEFLLKDGWIEQLEKDYKYEPKNKWGIMVPPFIDDLMDGIDDFFENLINLKVSTVRMNEKYIKNIIKLFQLYLKEYKERNK
jgi:transcriptional regulator with XRE-family HTH domain